MPDLREAPLTKRKIFLNDSSTLAALDLNYADLLPQDRDARVVEIGCGAGRFAAFLASKGYRNYLGLDIDPEAVRELKAATGLDAFVVQSVEDYLRQQTEPMDLVVFQQSIYYWEIEALQRLLRLISERLSSRGVLLIEVFNGALLTSAYIRAKDPRITLTLTEHSLRRELERLGYEVLAIAPVRLCAARSPLGLVWRAANRAWGILLRALYLIERGVDVENPRLLSKNILAVARASSR